MTELRRNSYASPWIELVPLLVITLTTAPVARPYSGSVVLLKMRTSWIESRVGTIKVPLSKLFSTSPPFTVNALPCSRAPLIEKSPLKPLPETDCWFEEALDCLARSEEHTSE